LDELGFGLDLSKCAATGARENLAYVSPRSGKAVSAEVGEPFQNRLFRLPAFLWAGGTAAPAEVIEGLKLAGFFLERHVFEPRGMRLPEQQDWIISALAERPH
jgi:DNA repair protein RecO (recombination protein O)